jgi:hypothetical protein
VYLDDDPDDDEAPHGAKVCISALSILICVICGSFFFNYSEDFDFNEAVWWSFVSTTTVGYWKNILLLTEYVILEYPSWLSTGMSLLVEGFARKYVFTGPFYYWNISFGPFFYWNNPADCIFCTGISLLVFFLTGITLLTAYFVLECLYGSFFLLE